MIVEVEGGVHDEPWILARDRIRRRALQSMGYHVMRVKNDELRRPETTANRILQAYYETADASRHVKVIQLHPQEMANEKHFTDSEMKALARQATPDIGRPDWTPNTTIQLLESIEPGVSHNQSAMDQVLLMCFGLGLKIDASSTARVVDFKEAAKLFGRFLLLMTTLFGEKGSQGMKNLLNISAPNFFKNLVLNGGPRINPGLAEIHSPEALKSQIVEFNANFNSEQVGVDEKDIVIEIRHAAAKPIDSLPVELQWTTEL